MQELIEILLIALFVIIFSFIGCVAFLWLYNLWCERKKKKKVYATPEMRLNTYSKLEIRMKSGGEHTIMLRLRKDEHYMRPLVKFYRWLNEGESEFYILYDPGVKRIMIARDNIRGVVMMLSKEWEEVK